MYPDPRPHHARLRARHRPGIRAHLRPPAGGGQPGSGQQPGGGYNPYDDSTDPTLQRLRALYEQRQGDAEANATQARNQLAIDYGDPSLALDETTRSAASANPFSRAALLKQAEDTQPRQLDQGLNALNLFYSSTRGQQQGDLQRSFLQQQAANAGDARSALSQIETGRMDTLSQIQDALAQAEQDAADRTQQRLGDLPMGGGDSSTPRGSRPLHVRPAHRPGVRQIVSPLRRSLLHAHHTRPRRP